MTSQAVSSSSWTRSDWNRGVSKAYGVQYDRFGGFGLQGVAKRSVFILDREGIVRYKWVTEDPKVPPDHASVLEKLKEMSA
ncbi:MAG TPA: hypothetical protein VEO96_10565 [Thermoplasmata archaeon]|nr:hypothetical protein [Thermoplasmata archaeon]